MTSPQPDTREAAIDFVIERLNKLIETPEVRKDLKALIETRIPVEAETGLHPDIITERQGNRLHLGFLGMLNGVLGAIPEGQPKEGRGPVMAVFDDHGVLSHFRRTHIEAPRREVR